MDYGITVEIDHGKDLSGAKFSNKQYEYSFHCFGLFPITYMRGVYSK